MTPTFSSLGLVAQLERAVAAAGYPAPRRSRRRPFHFSEPGATCSAARRPEPARRPRSRCPSSIDWRARHAPRAAAARARWCWRPRASSPCQIADGFRTYGRYLNIPCVAVFGGVGQGPQVDAFRRNVDIIVATPGRLLDLMAQRHAPLEAVEVLVLDEADRMLDMGFIDPIRRDRRGAAARPPEPDVLGDHAARDSQAGRHHPGQARRGRGRSGVEHRGRGRAVGAARPAATTSARCSARCCVTRR